MRALTFKQLGPIEAIELSQIPLQRPGKGQVRIKLTSAGLNRADTLFPEGRYFFKPAFTSAYSQNTTAEALFCRLGFEGAGIIDEVGEQVDYQVGDRVAITPLALDVCQQGCFAEYGIYEASSLIPTPEALSDQEAAAIWMQYLTAWGGLVLDGNLQAGQSVVITAASSSVGIAAIQIGNMLGATTIATTTNVDKVQQLKQLGAQYVINMKSDDYVEQIKAITNDKGTDLVFDAVAGPDIRYLVQGSSRGGKIIIQGMLDRRPMEIHPGVLMKRLLTITGFTLDKLIENKEQLQKAIDQITNGINQQQLTPVIAQMFKLDQFNEAFALLKSNKHTGKIVITP
ncbi:zinc-dependent alcohol dehydrogenase family protein [Alkalimarinus sediminis]|uniref:Zinc-dependent alcohol dehydrogenase family protein n=1 Tax=Alkalimarinus sediminis TaxID=1632866 RepID=A0A9E8HNE4_9ALTE|nr:zinc-dependent alcohol dehydrogenase family protein [Alkalimarinus sediminis]UZW76467.1 zinc-dependent alcohol dehydrogenase family protein [Alkalimarinus sediminis]